MMTILKEYNDLLISKGYKLSNCPYEFLDGSLTSVEYYKGEFRVFLGTTETDEFAKILLNMPEGTSYDMDFENYLVTSALITSPIINKAGFYDGSKEGITLVREPGNYITHSLDLFEYCLSLQGTDNLEHEKRILRAHLENLDAISPIIEVLKECDYAVIDSSLFNINNRDEGDSSDLCIYLRHPNDSCCVYFETDCLTGELKPGPEALKEAIGKDKKEIREILQHSIFDEDPLAFGYLTSDDPKETIDSYNEVYKLLGIVKHGDRDRGINPDIIPERYKDELEEYRKLKRD